MQSIPDNTPEKKCTGPCERTLPATRQYFHRDKYNPDELSYQCKKCRTAKTSAYNKTHADKISGYQRQWNADHREEKQQYNEQYFSDADRLELKRERGRQWYANDLQKNQQHARDYYQTESGRIASRANSANRRALSRKAGGRHTAQELRDLYEQQGCQCYHCGTPLGSGRDCWHADHLMPLSKGGTNDISNIVIACPTCNRKKHNKLPHEWRRGTS